MARTKEVRRFLTAAQRAAKARADDAAAGELAIGIVTRSSQREEQQWRMYDEASVFFALALAQWLGLSGKHFYAESLTTSATFSRDDDGVWSAEARYSDDEKMGWMDVADLDYSDGGVLVMFPRGNSDLLQSVCPPLAGVWENEARVWLVEQRGHFEEDASVAVLEHTSVGMVAAVFANLRYEDCNIDTASMEKAFIDLAERVGVAEMRRFIGEVDERLMKRVGKKTTWHDGEHGDGDTWAARPRTTIRSFDAFGLATSSVRRIICENSIVHYGTVEHFGPLLAAEKLVRFGGGVGTSGESESSSSSSGATCTSAPVSDGADSGCADAGCSATATATATETNASAPVETRPSVLATGAHAVVGATPVQQWRAYDEASVLFALWLAQWLGLPLDKFTLCAGTLTEAVAVKDHRGMWTATAKYDVTGKGGWVHADDANGVTVYFEHGHTRALSSALPPLYSQWSAYARSQIKGRHKTTKGRVTPTFVGVVATVFANLCAYPCAIDSDRIEMAFYNLATISGVAATRQFIASVDKCLLARVGTRSTWISTTASTTFTSSRSHSIFKDVTGMIRRAARHEVSGDVYSNNSTFLAHLRDEINARETEHAVAIAVTHEAFNTDTSGDDDAGADADEGMSRDIEGKAPLKRARVEDGASETTDQARGCTGCTALHTTHAGAAHLAVCPAWSPSTSTVLRSEVHDE